MGRTIGIDLGTTNTAVAVLDGGRPRVLEDSKGYKVLPSVVWVGDDGETVIGQAAKNLLLTDPTRTVYSTKRVLGRHFDSDVVTDARSKVGYEITPAEDGSCLIQMAHGALSPVEVSAHVLRTAREMAEKALGEEVDEAVITVPAYFNHAQRAATMEAAQQAGLRCERLLNEPTAAALAYGFKKEVERTLVIFDLGGGTFDVSVLRLSSGVYEILSTLGDSYLGGEDFDYRIVDHLAESFLGEHGVDLRKDQTTLHRLKDAAERAKCELSFTDKTTVLIPQVSSGLSLEMELDRLTLEGLVEDYVERSISVTRQAVADAGLQVSAVDEVILVGGQTRMPRIREAIAAMFDKEPSRSVHPEEVVAIGAAVHAASLVDDDITPAVLIDVTPFDLGIDVAGGMFQPIIQRNSTIPASAARVFATAQAQQTSVRITVRQGASRMAEDNEFLGEFIMGGLTPAPRMETKVEVNFKIDANGMLHVTAMEPATGKSTEITVRNYAEVAGSKGEVSPKVTGSDAVARGAQPAQEEAASEAKADAPAPADGGSAKKKSKSKKPKKAKKAKGGGLLGALFGRVSKKQAKAAAAAKAAPAPEEPSIIEAVAAEREAAAEDEGAPLEAVEELSAEALEELAAEPLEELSAEALEDLAAEPLEDLSAEALEDLAEEPLEDLSAEALEDLAVEPLDELSAESLEDLSEDFSGDASAEEEASDLDEPAPLFESQAPNASGGIVLPELEAAAFDALDAEAAEALEDENPFGLSEQPASVSMGSADLPVDSDGFEDDDLDEGLDDLDDDALFGDIDNSDLGDLGMDTPLNDLAEDELDAPEVPEAPADPDATMFSFATIAPETPAPEASAAEPAPSSFEDDETVRVAKPEAAPRKKPAKLKLSYKRPDAVVREYRENLVRGGCFVKTSKPLAVDREVRIEVRVPGLEDAIVIPGVVTWSSRDADELEPGQAMGMGIEYQLDDAEKAHIGELLDVLSGE